MSNSISNTLSESVEINGVRWATRNVDAPGTFVPNPEDAGQYYQWDRKDFNDHSYYGIAPRGEVWDSSHDPSPCGYRVPTKAEMLSLLDDKVRGEWATENGVEGARFTDKNNGNSIFLPAAGYRQFDDGGTPLQVGELCNYWTATKYEDNGIDAYFLLLDSNGCGVHKHTQAFGFPVRPVAEES
jgi:uncharacterized protein (TIGR02145 family)